MRSLRELVNTSTNSFSFTPKRASAIFAEPWYSFKTKHGWIPKAKFTEFNQNNSRHYRKERNIGKLFVTHLNPGFCEPNSHGDLLSHEYIRVMSLGEAALQFVQLCGRKASPMSLLLRRFFRVGGRARRQTLLLLLLSYLLWRKPRWRFTQWGSSQATGVMVWITAVVQRGGFQLGMVTL